MSDYGRRPERSKIRHGMASCARYGCSRDECRRAYRRAHARTELDRARGISGVVDAAPATRHIHQLQLAGISLGDITARSGLSRDRISVIARSGTERIMRTTQDAILGIPVPGKPVSAQTPGLIDAIGSRRRLQALAACGWTRASISTRTGLSARTIGDLGRGDQARIYIAHHQAITRVYEQLWNQRPEDHGVNPIAASRLRALATRRKWSRPADLDDDLIDIPDIAA